MPHGPRLSYLPDFKGRESLYRRLDVDKLEARVLKVWPSEDFLSSLEGSLQVVSLKDGTRPYDAPSYYWGSANDLDDVIVHGSDQGAPMPSVKVPVTKNLISALRQLRKQWTAACEPLGIWTDALCINQRDAEERSHQLSLMRQIFQSSRSVRVWLGARGCSPAAGNGLASLVAISHYLDVHAFHGEPAWHGGHRSVTEHTFEAQEMLYSMCALMDLPYWRRGWVLQEVCVHDVPVFFHLGDQSCKLVSWRLFDRTLHRALDLASQNMFDALESLMDNVEICMPFVLAMILRAADMRGIPLELKRSRALDRALDMMIPRRRWQTTDPRDFVHVLHGLHPMFRELQVRYSDDVETVLSDATIILLQWTGKWSSVHWSIPSVSAYLPSWVVDFSSSVTEVTATEYPEELFVKTGRFNSSASSSLRVQAQAPQMLSTAGFVFDKIVDITRCLTHAERMSDYDNSQWAEWLQFILRYDHMLTNPVSLFRTLCAGLGPQDRAFHPSDINHFRDSPMGDLFDLRMSEPPRDEQERRTFDYWKLSVHAHMHHKRLFTTETGAIGLAHRSAAVGDSVAIFASGDIPFVVRRVSSDITEEAYILIGGCYVDGAMHGEAVYDRGFDVAERTQKALVLFPALRQSMEMMSSLNFGFNANRLLADRLLAEDLPYKRNYSLKRTGSLDCLKAARAQAAELALTERLYLV